MVSGRTGQAGLAVRSRVVKERDVELVAVTVQLQAKTVGHVSAPISRPMHVLYEIAQVSQCQSSKLHQLVL